jgi:hypothetical protein
MDDEPLVLLTATCRLGHTWDVWATEGDDHWVVKSEEAHCPTCNGRAVKVEEPPYLA